MIHCGQDTHISGRKAAARGMGGTVWQSLVFWPFSFSNTVLVSNLEQFQSVSSPLPLGLENKNYFQYRQPTIPLLLYLSTHNVHIEFHCNQFHLQIRRALIRYGFWLLRRHQMKIDRFHPLPANSRGSCS